MLVQPDLFVVLKAEAITGDWTRMQSLVLVAEILSPSTARRDRFHKRTLYRQQGVETVRLSWHPDGAAEPLVIHIQGLLAP